MMNTLLRMAVLYLILSIQPASAVAQAVISGCGLISVPPESEALVLDADGIFKRKLFPGRHFCIPKFEKVVIEVTTRERTESLDSGSPVDDCHFSVFVVWTVSDLESYHFKGRDKVATVMQKMVMEAMDLAHVSRIKRDELSAFFWSEMKANAQSLEEYGARLSRSFVRSPDCAIQ